jgi:hypothetical protein
LELIILEEIMGRTIGIISVWLLVLSSALPGIAQAATLTLFQGGMVAEAEPQAGFGGPVQYAYPRASALIADPGYYHASASASSYISSSGSLVLSVSASGEGLGSEVGWSEASTSDHGEFIGFILFRVDNTAGENIQYGQLNYSYGWSSSGNYSNADSLFSMKINGDIVVPTIFNAKPFIEGESFYPGASISGSMSGVFDVTVGDIIGISLAAGGDMDGYGWYESSCGASFSLTGFGFQAPVPPTVLLLGSGLLGLAGWRRFRKS